MQDPIWNLLTDKHNCVQFTVIIVAYFHWPYMVNCEFNSLVIPKILDAFKDLLDTLDELFVCFTLAKTGIIYP